MNKNKVHVCKLVLPGAPLTYFNDEDGGGGGGGGEVRQRFIFYTQKKPNFRICLPKKIPTFFSIPKKWHLIENQPLLREIYKDPSLLSYRKGRSL